LASKRSVKLGNRARKARVPQRSRTAARPALPEKRATIVPRNEGWLLAGVILVTAIAYLRCLGNGFVFDDLTMIRINEYIGEWSFLWRSMVHDSWWFRDPNHLPQSEYYRPLQDIWLALNYHLFGFNPLGWHAATIVLHLVAVWLVYQIVRVIAPGGRTAAIAALLFGLIPIHTEAVAWATAIPLPLSSTFELGAFYFFLRREAAPRRNWALSLLLYACALLSHESAIVFPGLIASYALLLEPRMGISVRLETPAAQITDAAAGDTEALRVRFVRAAIETLPFAVEIGGYLVLRLSMLGFLHRIFSMKDERTAQILMTAPWTLLHFFCLVVVPWSAAPWHRVRWITSPFSPEFYGPLAAFALIAAVLMFGRFRKRRLYLFCAAWFVLPLIPEMDLIVSTYLTFVADRFLYLPSFGWCLFLADAITTSAAANASLRKPVFIGVAGLAGLYGFVLFGAQRFWHDGVTFFSYCVEEFPEAALCHQGLGNAFGMRLDLTDAQRELSIAVSLNPEIFNVRWDLGMVEGRMEHYTEAVNEMRASLALRPGRSASDYAIYADYADTAGEAAECERALEVTEALLGGRKEAQLVRARMRFRHGDAVGAMQILNEMVAQYPDEMRVWLLMGTIRMARKDYDGAFASFERAIAITPDLPAAHYNAADALHHLGRNAEALIQCRAALALAPYYQEARALMTVIQQHGSAN
jgi:tetratricopeptide (TPR) repeat protein